MNYSLPNTDETGKPTVDRKSFSNRLIFEKSPYLLQHADNPVGWYPWGDEAFAKAKEDSKPIFLSVGYSTCHWCHVMASRAFSTTFRSGNVFNVATGTDEILSTSAQIRSACSSASPLRSRQIEEI